MKLNFHTALQRMVSEELRGNNPIPDPLGFLHLKYLWGSEFSSELEKLLEGYEKESDNVNPLFKIDVPKANFAIRPMSRPETKDWLIYEAIIDYLSKKILRIEDVCKRSFSILGFKTNGIKRTEAWLKFDEKCRNLYGSGYKHAVVSDLTGYYENVNLEELRKRIINYLEEDGNDQKLTNVLTNLLRKWSDERIKGHGLPQGPPASSFLADIYLDYIDRKMEKYEGYFRYMDDIRIFCERKIEAKVALKDLIIALREIKLNINAKKTDILTDKKIEERLFDPQKSLLNIIESEIKTKDRRRIQEIIFALLKLFEDAFSNDPFEKTHLNFALYRLSVLHTSGFEFDTTKVIKIIEKNFISNPHHTGLFCNFLTLFPRNKGIIRFLISFLRSEDNIYEWQELKMLQAILKFEVASSAIDRENIDFFINAARDSNKHYAVRAFYFLCGGKYGSNRDRELIVDCYRHLLHVYTKIAVILAVQELGNASRNDFYSQVKRNDTNKDIVQFVDYVRTLSNPIYYLTKERPKIETYEDFEILPYESI